MTQNNSMNHHHGTVVREQWPVGTPVKFKPKGLNSGEPLQGIIVGHMFVNVLVIEAGAQQLWWCSTFRCEKF